MFNIKDLSSPIKAKKASGLLIKNNCNIYYLTNYSGEGYIYLEEDGKISLYVDGRYAERARIEINKDLNISIIEIKALYVDIANSITGLFNKTGKPAILFESTVLTYEEFLSFKKAFGRSVRLVPSHNILTKIRSIKDNNELLKIKRAVSIAESSFFNSIKFALESDLQVSEQDIAANYKKSLLSFNSKESFETIVLSNKNASMPHGVPSDKRIYKASGVLLFDFGAEFGGYKSDETVTMYFGKPGRKFCDVYDTVYSAQQLAISKIRPGIKFKDLDETARDYIEKRGYGKYFTHSLGHGVGLDIHEYPYIHNKNSDTVKEGMVFTIEPGIYIEGEFGVRIEDMCYVESGGVQVITNIDKSSFNIKDKIKINSVITGSIHFNNI